MTWFRRPTLPPLPTPAADLVDRAVKRLAASPQVLIDAADARLGNPGEVLVLADQYRTMTQSEAWKHYTGRLLAMKGLLQEAILKGEKDKFGNDLTPYFRASYGILLQVLAVPAQIEGLKEEAENVLMGGPVGNANDMPGLDV